jgi:hypothetical protein
MLWQAIAYSGKCIIDKKVTDTCSQLQILESSNSKYDRPAFDGSNTPLCTADFCKLLSIMVQILL